MVNAVVNPFRPATLPEALEIRGKTGALPFAGGTDLMVKYRAKNGMPPTMEGPLMFVDSLSELRTVRFSGASLDIGASVPLAVVADDPGERAAYAASGTQADAAALTAIPELLRAASADLGAPALRPRATMAGNVANASPAGDTVAALYALDAAVVLTSTAGERIVPINEFITGPGKTILKADELITAIRIPGPLPVWSYWRKVGTRRANALTKVSAAASVRVEAGRITGFALAFGAVGPIVVRSPDAEALLIGKSAADLEGSGAAELVRAVADAAAPGITPIDDQRSTARYRKTVALNLIGEVISSLAAHLKENNT